MKHDMIAEDPRDQSSFSQFWAQPEIKSGQIDKMPINSKPCDCQSGSVELATPIKTNILTSVNVRASPH